MSTEHVPIEPAIVELTAATHQQIAEELQIRHPQLFDQLVTTLNARNALELLSRLKRGEVSFDEEGEADGEPGSEPDPEDEDPSDG